MKLTRSLIVFIIGLIGIILLLMYMNRPDIQNQEKVHKKIYTLHGLGMDSIEYSCNGYTKECSFPQMSHPCCVTAVMEIYKYLRSLLTLAGIPIYIYYGTLLGFYRHNGIIPWDDDFDTAIKFEDAYIIEELRPLLEKKGFRVQRTTGKSKSTDHPDYDYYTIYFSQINMNHVDIALLRTIVHDGIQYFLDAPVECSPEFKKPGSKWLVTKSSFDKCRDHSFYDGFVTVPDYMDMIKVLTEMYGPNFMIPLVKSIPGPGGDKDIMVKGSTTVFKPALKTLTSSSSWKRSIIKKALIINDMKRYDRLHNIMYQLLNLGINGERVDAVMHYGLDLDSVKHLIGIDKQYGPLKKGEIGCYLSHIKCWEYIAQSNDRELYLVLEDDADLTDDFNEILMDCFHYLRNTEKWDICQLGGDVFHKHDISKLPNEKYIYETGQCTGAYAYILHPSSAKKLLATVYPITLPVDLVITTFDTTKFKKRKNDYTFPYNNFKRIAILKDPVYPMKTKFRFGIVDEDSTRNNDSMSSS